MVVRDATLAGDGSVKLKNIQGTLEEMYVLSESLRAKKDRRVGAKTVRSDRQQSTGWNIEVHDPPEGTAGEKARCSAECDALIVDISTSPCRHGPCTCASALLDPRKRSISCGRYSCRLHAPRATCLAGVDAGETGNGRCRIIRGVVGTGECHGACSRICD